MFSQNCEFCAPGPGGSKNTRQVVYIYPNSPVAQNCSRKDDFLELGGFGGRPPSQKFVDWGFTGGWEAFRVHTDFVPRARWYDTINGPPSYISGRACQPNIKVIF